MKSRPIQNTHPLMLELVLACAAIVLGTLGGAAVGWRLASAFSPVPTLGAVALCSVTGGALCSVAILLLLRHRMISPLRALAHQFSAPHLFAVPPALECSSIREIARLWHGVQEFHPKSMRLSTVVIPPNTEGVEAAPADEQLLGIRAARVLDEAARGHQEKHSGTESQPPAALMQVLESSRREVREARKEREAALKNYFETDEKYRKLLLRMEQQRALLSTLSAKYGVDSLLKPAYLSDILAQCCEILALEDASVWLFTSDRDLLRCVGHFDRSRTYDRMDESLRRKDHHLFFMSLEFEALIAARNIAQDPRTRTLADLDSRKNHSMLAAPLFGNRGLVGAILYESAQQDRHWEADEEMFGLTLSHFLGQHLPEQAEKPGRGRVLHVYEPDRTEPSRIVHLPAIEEFREAPQYRLFFESLGAMVWAIDNEGRFIMLNPLAEDAYGFETGGMLGSPLFNFVSATAGNADRHALQAILQGEEFRVYETRHLTRAGHLLPLRVTLTALQDETGEIIGAVGVAQDLSESEPAYPATAANQE
ncbi:MAG: PAS domain S-box protein [Candidatus Hydrogenedentes bacterium]|nr:PAS domain S-box protein [Candidatus Hydrogenedentota bacterium]